MQEATQICDDITNLVEGLTRNYVPFHDTLDNPAIRRSFDKTLVLLDRNRRATVTVRVSRAHQLITDTQLPNLKALGFIRSLCEDNDNRDACDFATHLAEHVIALECDGTVATTTINAQYQEYTLIGFKGELEIRVNLNFTQLALKPLSNLRGSNVFGDIEYYFTKMFWVISSEYTAVSALCVKNGDSWVRVMECSSKDMLTGAVEKLPFGIQQILPAVMKDTPMVSVDMAVMILETLRQELIGLEYTGVENCWYGSEPGNVKVLGQDPYRKISYSFVILS